MSPTYVIELRLKDGSIRYVQEQYTTETLQHARIATSEASKDALVRKWKNAATNINHTMLYGALVRAVPVEIVRVQLTNNSTEG
jgi:hypothetical protein